MLKETSDSFTSFAGEYKVHIRPLIISPFFFLGGYDARPRVIHGNEIAIC